MIAINRRTLLTSLAAAGLYRGSAFAQAPSSLPSWSDSTVTPTRHMATK
jgi:hypothetical protein